MYGSKVLFIISGSYIDRLKGSHRSCRNKQGKRGVGDGGKEDGTTGVSQKRSRFRVDPGD